MMLWFSFEEAKRLGARRNKERKRSKHPTLVLGRTTQNKYLRY
jgi:hypothetical protein